eukprot:1303551-Pleurochrysis_carterae.AAC.2
MKLPQTERPQGLLQVSAKRFSGCTAAEQSCQYSAINERRRSPWMRISWCLETGTGPSAPRRSLMEGVAGSVELAALYFYAALPFTQISSVPRAVVTVCGIHMCS